MHRYSAAGGLWLAVALALVTSSGCFRIAVLLSADGGQAGTSVNQPDIGTSLHDSGRDGSGSPSDGGQDGGTSSNDAAPDGGGFPADSGYDSAGFPADSGPDGHVADAPSGDSGLGDGEPRDADATPDADACNDGCTPALVLEGQLGLLDTSGTNPATGSDWAAGDTYRLVFRSSTTRNSTSTDIAVYNAHVQSAANAAGLGAVNWYVIGSTATVDARTNTNTTGASIDGAFLLLDGKTVIANNIADLWDGSIDNRLDMTERRIGGVTGDIHTGSLRSGAIGSRPLGGSGETPPLTTCGRSQSTGSEWIRVWRHSTTTALPFYGMSELLTVQEVPR
jgi:hypothetical protein